MKTKKIMTALLTVIMLSTPCSSVFAWRWRRYHHRPWRHRHYHRKHHIDAALFTIPFAIAATAAAHQTPSNLWPEIINNRKEIQNLAQKIKTMEAIIADRDKEVDNQKKMINEMRDRIIELERKIK